MRCFKSKPSHASARHDLPQKTLVPALIDEMESTDFRFQFSIAEEIMHSDYSVLEALAK